MSPTLLHFGFLRIPMFGFFMALAFLAGIFWAERGAKQKGIKPEIIFNLSVWIMISAIAGARALYVILEWQEFKDDLLKIITPPFGGIVFYGGFLGAFATAYFYLRRNHLSVWTVGDILAPALALGQAVGRWGCFFNGCCYGAPINENLPWGIHFPVDSMPYQQYGGVALHPTQIYESLGCFLIFLILLKRLKKQTFSGEVLWSYVVLYGILRFIIEIFRGDDRGFMMLQVSISQWISLLIVPIALFMLLKKRTVPAN